MSEARTIAAPEPNTETQTFWDAAENGKLMIMKCKDTGKFYFYPRARSPYTLSDNVEWVEAKGTGEIWRSHSIISRMFVCFQLDANHLFPISFGQIGLNYCVMLKQRRKLGHPRGSQHTANCDLDWPGRTKEPAR